jgi:hypothetical protein
MKRIRWLSAQWPVSLRTIASKMKANAFTQNSFNGFLVERVRDTSIEARYIEKLTYQETLTDPFGNEEILDRVTYRQIEFGLFADFPNIELWDSPRSTQSFVSRLLELSDFSLSVSHLQVNLLDWTEAFQGQVKRPIIIDSLQIAGLELEKGVSAKMLVKGDKDVREALDHFTEGKPYILEKLQFRVQLDRSVASIHLASNGSAKMPVEFVRDFLPSLRQSLPEPVSR